MPTTERGGADNTRRTRRASKTPIYLSQFGHERLEEDALGKMQQYAGALASSRHPLVLHADETNVLLAYMEPLNPPSFSSANDQVMAPLPPVEI